MKPGRELDRFIAKNVMGDPNPTNSYYCDGPSYFDPPAYSTSIEAAWEVVEKVWGEKWFRLDRTQSMNDDWRWTAGEVEYFMGDNVIRNTVYSASAPHAICLAALEALGVETP